MNDLSSIIGSLLDLGRFMFRVVKPPRDEKSKPYLGKTFFVTIDENLIRDLQTGKIIISIGDKILCFDIDEVEIIK